AGDRRTRARERVAALAEREREVALRMGRGLANAQTAADLFMSVPTAKTHVSRVLAKLSLGNRVRTALLVHDAGLLDEDAY
ncbi:LuxR C-terminal-related transcriptional regulator, partial [Streptomyces sp. NPDC007070]|uniref:response regulator transcription factor n=1 Tax=Streptomyces sp. NPDC007070 TaxID=3154312 RepID=UPI0033DE9292